MVSRIPRRYTHTHTYIHIHTYDSFAFSACWWGRAGSVTYFAFSFSDEVVWLSVSVLLFCLFDLGFFWVLLSTFIMSLVWRNALFCLFTLSLYKSASLEDSFILPPIRCASFLQSPPNTTILHAHKHTHTTSNARQESTRVSVRFLLLHSLGAVWVKGMLVLF